MKRRRGRVLSEEETVLWRYVTRSVNPLPGHERPPEPPSVPKVEKEAIISPKKPIPPVPTVSKTERQLPAPPPLIPLERRQMRDLRRGLEQIDARIDLHGMRQTEAHYTLMGFLRRSQASGARIVLVVTGKGSSNLAMADPFNERGVLRRLVPQWLGLADMRSVVLGFSNASREHGGEGALYVRLRRGMKGPAR